MAGVSAKEIKTRVRSMESTRQITKAMEMVAASKMRKTQNQVLAARPYYYTLQEMMGDMIGSSRDMGCAYLHRRQVKKTACVVIAGDRGLAGGYNSNVLKAVDAQLENKAALVLPVGKKALEFFQNRKTELLSETYCDAEDMTLGDCFTAAKNLCNLFLSGTVDEVVIVYTECLTLLSQEPRTIRLLPLIQSREQTAGSHVLYEPDRETVLDAVIPEYLGGVLYGALCESRAAEQAARRMAMDSATRNADEMITTLRMAFNRARQAAITGEIVDIVAAF